MTVNLDDVTVLILGPGAPKQAAIEVLQRSDDLKSAAKELGGGGFIGTGLDGVSAAKADAGKVASTLNANPLALEVLRAVRDGLNTAIAQVEGASAR